MRIMDRGLTSAQTTTRRPRGGLAISPPSYGVALADAPVQRLAKRPGGSAAAIHRDAEQGVQDGGHRLPHFEAIQRAFGDVDLGAIRAHTSPQASASARAIGASAYAIGGHVAFAQASPSLHDVAHEAAHVVQQQAGLRLPGGVGRVGDVHERHADAVAQATVAGRSAAPLLQGLGHGGGAAATSATSSVQRIKKGGTAEAPTYLSQLASGKPEVAPGKGYIRAIAKSDAESFTTDHAWVAIEYVAKDTGVPRTIVTDLRLTEVTFNEGSNAEAHVTSLMGKKYIGTTYPITEAGALAAIAKSQDISAGFQFDAVKTQKADGVWATNSVPRATNKYTYNITGKASFMPGNRINCARYAAKLLKAAGVGSGWFEVRPRGGMFFKTPAQVATGFFGQTKN